jgi:hypothetical protein
MNPLDHDPQAQSEVALHELFQSICTVSRMMKDPITRECLLREYPDLELAYSELFRVVQFARDQAHMEAAE